MLLVRNFPPTLSRAIRVTTGKRFITRYIKAPDLPESVKDATMATYQKTVGDAVSVNDVVCSIETDKVMLEVVSPYDGVLTSILAQEGDRVLGNAEVCAIECDD